MLKKFYYLLLILLYTLLSESNAFAFSTDNQSYVITVTPTENASATTDDIQKAITFLTTRKDPQNRWTLSLSPGKYYLTRQISASGLQNTVITSSDLTKPAQLIKAPGWDSAKSAEYLLYFRMCKMLNIIGIEFYGQTNFEKDSNPFWPDQGVYLGSCQIVKVDSNKFYNFGNAALRVVTDSRDPVVGVNSFKTQVSNNLFNNIFQTATTSTDKIHGGTAQSTWSKNTFVNIRGSIKFASRTPGARQIEFINNKITGGEHYGLEIDNYSDFLIKGNTFENIKEYAITIYTNGDPTTLQKGFAWGDNFTISNNVIKNVGNAIRFSHNPFFDGTQNTPKNLTIDNNTIDTVTNPTPYIPAIQVLGSTVEGLQVTNNKMSNIHSNAYIKIPNDNKDTAIQSNLVNNKIYEVLPASTK